MCQARVSLRFSSVLVWTILGSLTFGFCSVWSLHFVAMLAYELDLKIGINVPYTILSAMLAVLFTFVALGSDMLWDTYKRESERKHWRLRRRQSPKGLTVTERQLERDHDSRPLLRHSEDDVDRRPSVENAGLTLFSLPQGNHVEEENLSIDIEAGPGSSTLEQMAFRNDPARRRSATFPPDEPLSPITSGQPPGTPFHDRADSNGELTDSSEQSASRRSSSLFGSNSSSYGLSSIMNIAYRSASPAKNAFIATGESLYTGFTRKNITKGFFWSLAITSMHYSGLKALRVPEGYPTLNPWLVILSALISWCVCVVGCILMPQSKYCQLLSYYKSFQDSQDFVLCSFTAQINQIILND
jgi:NO-binding membrane sensor protein with MHYT domain